MARSAKQVDDITEKTARAFIKDVLAHFENIDTAKARYANAARKERDAMAVLYEGLAAKGISQRASRLNVKIARGLQKIVDWMSELELEDQRQAQRLAKLQADRKQLQLWSDLPKASKPKKGKADNVVELEFDKAAPAAAE
jgi:hypothetical protein